MKFPQKVRWMVECAGWSIKRLADESGMNPSTLDAAIRRNKSLCVDVALKLARTMGVSLDWLCDDARGKKDVCVNGEQKPWWLVRVEGGTHAKG